jgi:malate dehydrogenase (oxaloacetate-decarboxylating)
LVFVDSCGVVCEGRRELEEHKRQVALSRDDLAAVGLPEQPPNTLGEIVAAVKPSILIGTTGQPGDFTPEVVRLMADSCERPIILPLSNPTSKAECTPSEALQHSDGRALVATGSPFEPVVFQGRKYVIGQCNNVFVFPGVGLGVLISESSRVTESMFLAAARALANYTASNESAKGCLYPSLRDLRAVSRLVALKVAQIAREEGFGRALDDASLEAAIEEFCWKPEYGRGVGSENRRGGIEPRSETETGCE